MKNYGNPNPDQSLCDRIVTIWRKKISREGSIATIWKKVNTITLPLFGQFLRRQHCHLTENVVMKALPPFRKMFWRQIANKIFFCKDSIVTLPKKNVMTHCHPSDESAVTALLLSNDSIVTLQTKAVTIALPPSILGLWKQHCHCPYKVDVVPSLQKWWGQHCYHVPSINIYGDCL